MLKLILAVSADGYFARGPSDDMRWTGATDKKVFKLLTSVGAVCGVGSSTFRQMPRLKGRRLVPLSRRPDPVPNYRVDELDARPGSAVPDWAAMVTPMTLGRFAHAYPEAWLLGGPTVAQEALEIGLVDQVYLCRSPTVLHGEQPAFKALYRDEITPWLQCRGERQNAGIPWSREQRIQLDGVTVDCWSRKDACRS